MLDKIDLELLRILSKDARTPFRQIAKTLRIGTDTVFRRFKKLEKKGIILGSTVILSSKVSGFQGLFGLFIKTKSGSDTDRVSEKLKKIPELSFSLLSGSYDFYAEMYFRDFQDILSLIGALRSIDEIVVIDPMIYTLDDWSIPYVYNFELELPNWLYPIQK
jgi:Transcriptional regulators